MKKPYENELIQNKKRFWQSYPIMSFVEMKIMQCKICTQEAKLEVAKASNRFWQDND